MVSLSRSYDFRPDIPTLRAALKRHFEGLPGGEAETPRMDLTVEVGMDSWQHDSLEEFFADYAKDEGGAALRSSYSAGDDHYVLSVNAGYIISDLSVSVDAPTRAQVHSVLEVFDEAAAAQQEKADAFAREQDHSEEQTTHAETTRRSARTALAWTILGVIIGIVGLSVALLLL